MLTVMSRLRVVLPVILRCFPEAFRARHGRALAQTVTTDWHRRPAGFARLALIIDLCVAGLSERRTDRRRRRRPHPTMSRQGVTMTGLGSDIAHAWRALRHRPTFALITVAILAIGLGATTAMFSVVDAVLLRPLPYPADQELVAMAERLPARGLAGVGMPSLAEWATFPELQSVAAHSASNLLFHEGGGAERVAGVAVSPTFFSTLGVAPAQGRTFDPGGPFLDPDRKIVLSDGLWRRQFGGDPSAIGRTLVLERYAYTVIGVMPAGFAYPGDAQFWTSLPPEMAQLADARSVRFLQVIARLAPGHDLRALRTRLADWKRGLATSDPTGKSWIPDATSLRDEAVGQVRAPLLIVSAGVWLLLVVACANAAAMVLANARAKVRDLAVQSALGAGRGRLVSQMLVEGLMLTLAGAALALLIAALTRDAIVAVSLNQIPRVSEMHVDLRALLFAAGVAIVASIGIALGPALAVTRTSHAAVLQSGSRSTTASGAGRSVFGPLVAVEFALALVLASAAGLLAASYAQLKQVDAGFDPSDVISARVDLPNSAAWSSDAARRRFHDQLLADVRRMPGVERAALVNRLPLSEVRGGTDAWPDGRVADTTPALLQLASEHYFDTMGARITDGRDLAVSDTDTAPLVAVVNDVLAKKFWPSQSPINHTLTYQFMRGPVTVTIVGVVTPMRYGDLTSDTRPEIYVTFRQSLNTPVMLTVKSASAAGTLVPALRAALAAADASGTVTFTDVATLETRLARVLARPRFYLIMVVVFGVTAVLLAALGIYGTMTFWIGERWREFGIRVALGANRADVTRLIVSRGLSFAAMGLVAGLVGAVLLRRVIGQLLFHVSPADPRLLIGTAVLLAGTATLAALLPARRVATVDPVATLKGE
jgi:predicted permease